MKRPFGVTILALIVVFIAINNCLRFIQAIFFWKILVEYGADVSYIAISGGFWLFMALFLLDRHLDGKKPGPGQEHSVEWPVTGPGTGSNRLVMQIPMPIGHLHLWSLFYWQVFLSYYYPTGRRVFISKDSKQYVNNLLLVPNWRSE